MSLDAYIVINQEEPILAIFRSFFGKNDDFINLFWDLLTFSNAKTHQNVSNLSKWPIFVVEIQELGSMLIFESYEYL